MKDVDLLVRIGVLETLTDKLQNRVDELAGAVRVAESNSKELLNIVASLKEESSKDEWETPADSVKPETQPDEVDQIFS